MAVAAATQVPLVVHLLPVPAIPPIVSEIVIGPQVLGWSRSTRRSRILLVALTAVVLLLVRGSPALLYRSFLSRREMMAAGLLQATSLSFIVAATQIGVESNKLSSATAAGLLAGGAVSVLLFPALAVSLLRTEPAT